MARLESAPSGKVILSVRLFLTLETAERLTTRAIREQKAFEAVVAEILEAPEPD